MTKLAYIYIIGRVEGVDFILVTLLLIQGHTSSLKCQILTKIIIVSSCYLLNRTMDSGQTLYTVLS